MRIAHSLALASVLTWTALPVAFADGVGTTRSADVRATSLSLSSAVNSFIDIPINGASIVGLRFAGLASSGATVSFLSSNDATQTPASPINSLNAATGALATTRTIDGETRIPVAGRTTLRVAVTTGGSGTITVSYNVSSASGIVDTINPIQTAALGTPADTAYNGSGTPSIIAALKGIYTASSSALPAGSNTIGNVGITGTLPAFTATPTFNIGTAPTIAVTGTFFQTTQPISVASGGLAVGAGTDGWDATQGAKADGGYTGTGSASVIALLKGLYASASGSLPTGANVVGKFGIDQTTPGTTNGVVVTSPATVYAPTAASGKITKNEVALSANTSTQVAAANTSRIGLVIECPAGGVQFDETGGTLTSASTGGTFVIGTSFANNPYVPPVITLTAITAYTGTAQSCKVTEFSK